MFNSGSGWYDSRDWFFIADMDHNYSITISDVWLWFQWLYFYPGDAFIYFIINKVTPLSNFFEITYNNYGGFLSGFISFIFWILALLIIANKNDL